MVKFHQKERKTFKRHMLFKYFENYYFWKSMIHLKYQMELAIQSFKYMCGYHIEIKFQVQFKPHTLHE